MNCSVGPVIGEVTDKTARILLECDASGPLDLELVSDDGKHHHKESQVLTKGQPKVFKFDKLAPGTRYTVTTKMVKIVSSKFKTLPPGGFSVQQFKTDGRGPRFGFVSGNDVYATLKRDKIRKSICLWRDLASTVKRFDYLLHLGDNTYVDANKQEKPENKWQAALAYIADDGEFYEHKWENRKEEIRDIFRSAYRETWGTKATRAVLANVPNLMVYAENDIAQNWISRETPQKGSVEAYISMQVYHVLGEYQTQLHKDFFDVSANDVGYHFHPFGDIGFYFQDTVGCKTLNKDNEKRAMLGERQWSDFTQALGTGGIFDKTKFLFVLMPRPVFVLSEEDTSLVTGPAVRNMWMNKPYIPEATQFLDEILSWKLGACGREVLLVGGSASHGGWTIINVGDESGVPSSTLTQLTTGPTTPDPANVDLPKDVVKSTMVSKHHGIYSFKHFGWTNHRNYAMVEMIKDAEHASYIGNLVEASDYIVEKRASFDARLGAENYRECELCLLARLLAYVFGST